jgi:hypothetical protein
LKKQLLVTAAVATVAIGTLGVGIANAATSPATSKNDNLVAKIAAKFGLKTADVQAVFDQQKAARTAERTQDITDKLAAGVKAGTITQAQSDLIKAKINQLQTVRAANRATLENMTDIERKTAIDADKTALTNWISDNKIPNEFVRLLRVGGRAGHRGLGGDKDSSSTSTNN